MERQLRARGLTLGEAGIDAAQIVAVVNDVLVATQVEPAPVGADTRLDALGLDSLDMAELFFAVEEVIGGEIDPESTAGLATVGDLTNLRRR